ncbi:MAG: helicase-exonuclease AddAB subunit AddA [Clostridiales Family XIII bacterium]|jgi:ATP-dependent helicase/nuclease subunit A|nr:helicase-exonuclease AddAB subunit AddA [Clostridiales Family XIII bacterium]
MQKWTEAQTLAIMQRGKNMLVSAAAGSGKTTVLVERIRKIVVDEKTAIDRLLVVTFTEAAAGEMRQKIVDSIQSALEDTPEDRSESGIPPERKSFLQEQLQSIYRAQISTFHAFALTILRRYYYIIDLEPSFSICDDERRQILVNEALDALFEQYFEAEDPDFTEFMKLYANARSENNVRGIIEHLYDFIRSMPDPFGWLDMHTEALAVRYDRFEGSEVFTLVCAEIRKELKMSISVLEKLKAFLEDAKIPSLALKTAADIVNASELLTTLDASDPNTFDWDAFAAAGRNFEFERFSCKATEKADYEQIKDRANRIRERAKSRIKDLKTKYFTVDPTRLMSDIRDTAAPAQKLRELVYAFHERYSELKRRDGLIDFSDIEHFALKILEDERVCGEYRDKFEHIFIDEYQDSNYIQDELIRRICRDDNLFMVGDVKQSIYKFRLAEPEIFIKKYIKYGSACEDGTDAANIRIDLSSNFRSKAKILSSANHIFEKLMNDEISGIAYDDKAFLKQGLQYEPSGSDSSLEDTVRLILVETKSDLGEPTEEVSEELLDLKDAELEARAAAHIIKSSYGTPFFDTACKEVRSLKYRDIVILNREVRNTGGLLCDLLQREGIPAFVESGEGYFDTLEIETFMNLLRVIDNARQDVALAGTMTSAVFGFTADELIRIRLSHRAGPFYAAFFAFTTAVAETDTESGIELDTESDRALKRKCTHLIERIEGWRYDEMFAELPEFLWKVMKESGLYDYMGALVSGAQRTANLRALVDKASGYQQGRKTGLFGFISFVDTMKSRKLKTAQIKLLAENDDAVRIMTIHKSKGLEFPMVILGQLAKRFRQSKDEHRISFHKDLGIALQWEDYATHSYRKTLLQNLIKTKKDQEERAEDLRVLYVAMTRAMDRLVLLGTVAHAGDMLHDAYTLDPEVDLDLMKAKSYCDMLLPLLSSSGMLTEVFTVRDMLNAAARSEQKRDNAAALLRSLETEAESAYAAEVAGRLSGVYRYADAAQMKSKFSVSELAREERAKSETSSRSENRSKIAETIFFTDGSAAEIAEDEGRLAAERLNAAERGSALHKAFEKLDYRAAYENRKDRKYFERYLDALVVQEFLTEAQRDAVNAAVLQRYANTNIFARAAASPELRLEAPFNLRWKKDGEPVIVQGIIDCFFWEYTGASEAASGDVSFGASGNARIVLVDFKSNYYDEKTPGEDKRLIDLYRMQINLYREVLEKVYKVAVDDAYLYLTGAGKTLRIDR